MDNNYPIVGVCNIITDDQGKILLMKRPYNDYAYPGYWGLVGGLVECNETLEDALKREAMEEVGVEIEVIKFTGRYYDKLGRHPTKTAISLPFRTRIISGKPHPNQPEECIKVEWFTQKEIRNMELAFDYKQMLKDENLI